VISERESRMRIVEDCKYLMSRLPFGDYNFDHLGIQLSILSKKTSERYNSSIREIQINKESLDNHVLLSMFTTPELIELKISLVRQIKFEK
jgi:hypothetical protein